MVNETQELAKIETTHGPIELSVRIIKHMFCPKATDLEATLFLKLCQYQGLNPFLREAYLIKYGDAPASMVVGKDTFLQRAEAHPQYDGFEAGIIVQDEAGDENRLEGSRVPLGDKLIGGWAKVYRKDHSRPVYAEVDFAEFTTNQATWRKMPGVMIRKVALVQAFREAFPHSFTGLYDSSEMRVDLPEPEGEPQSPRNGTQEPRSDPPMTKEQGQGITRLAMEQGVNKQVIAEQAKILFGVASAAELTGAQADRIIEWLTPASVDDLFTNGENAGAPPVNESPDATLEDLKQLMEQHGFTPELFGCGEGSPMAELEECLIARAVTIENAMQTVLYAIQRRKEEDAL